MKLEANQLVFSYPHSKHPVLSGFDMQLCSGERVGLLAPSGRGKTTLCRILAGMIQPDKGTVLLDGKPLPRHGYSPVQMIWQHPTQAADPKMRMRNLLAEGGMTDPKVLEGLGIQPEWLNRFPGELSGGELQRFCIARVLGTNTQFLLADEITAMLDLITQSQIWRFLLTYAEKRRFGILIVSHSQSLLKQLCTRQISLP